MSAINYSRVYTNLCHIKALSHDHKFDEIVQHLILNAMCKEPQGQLAGAKDIVSKINEIYGILLREHIVQSNLDKLISANKIRLVDKVLHIDDSEAKKIAKNIQEIETLDIEVKSDWFFQLKSEFVDFSDKKLEILWDSLQKYLSKVFEQHGIQTLRLLNPTVTIDDENGFSLNSLIENIANSITAEKIDVLTLTKAVNIFFQEADDKRVNYLAQLADASFTSYALTTDEQAQKFLNAGYPTLDLLLDTNFIFGILDLHRNAEDTAAKEILEEAQKNRLPFKLLYHPETLDEFRRAFDAKAMYIRAAKWTRESSRIALTFKEISPIERLYHERNINEELDPVVFLEKYDHAELILKDLGFGEYQPKDSDNSDEAAEMEEDISKYEEFYNNIYRRKRKTYSGFKHDIVVLRDVRSKNKTRTSFLKSKAFFISSDFILAKFEKNYYKRSREINFVISPSVFLQLIRPFIKNDYNSNKRFVDTFSIPDLRAFDIDYSETRRRALQIINDNYHGASLETKMKIVRDEVLLGKMEQSKDEYETQVALVENRIAIENKQLEEQNKETTQEIEKITGEKEAANIKAELLNEELNRIKEENEKLKAIQNLNERLVVWEDNKKEYVEKKIIQKREQYKKDSKKSWGAFFAIIISAAIIPFIFKIDFPCLKQPIWGSVIALVLYVIIGLILFWRLFLVDKDVVKNGFDWILTFGFNVRKSKILDKHKSTFIKNFEDENLKPTV